MKSLLSPLKRIIFLSFILFTVFAGEDGCGCGNGSKPQSSQSGQKNSGGKYSSSSHQKKTIVPERIKTGKSESTLINPRISVEARGIKPRLQNEDIIYLSDINPYHEWWQSIKNWFQGKLKTIKIHESDLEILIDVSIRVLLSDDLKKIKTINKDQKIINEEITNKFNEKVLKLDQLLKNESLEIENVSSQKASMIDKAYKNIQESYKNKYSNILKLEENQQFEKLESYEERCGFFNESFVNNVIDILIILQNQAKTKQQIQLLVERLMNSCFMSNDSPSGNQNPTLSTVSLKEKNLKKNEALLNLYNIKPPEKNSFLEKWLDHDRDKRLAYALGLKNKDKNQSEKILNELLVEIKCKVFENKPFKEAIEISMQNSLNKIGHIVASDDLKKKIELIKEEILILKTKHENIKVLETKQDIIRVLKFVYCELYDKVGDNPIFYELLEAIYDQYEKKNTLEKRAKNLFEKIEIHELI